MSTTNLTFQPILVKAPDLKHGDIIKVFIDDLDKHKYFLVLHHGTPYGAVKVLYLNSGNPYQDDIVFNNSYFPCIPASRTGETVVNCGRVEYLGHEYLDEREVLKIGRIPKPTSQALVQHFTHKVTTLEPKIRAFVLAVLAAM